MYFRDKEKKGLWTVFFIIQCCGLIISFVFTTLNSFILSVPQGYLNEIIENFRDHPLMEISEMFSSCPGNQNQITFGTWPGTKHGCNCLGRYPETSCYNRLCTGICSFNETYAGCHDVYSTSSVDINVWKGKRLCSSQVQYNYEYLLNKSVKEGENCPDKYKKCGKLDYMKNILCYPINEDCPINHLVVTQSSTSPTEYKYQTVPLTNGYYIHYTNQAIDNFVVRSKIKDGDELPCIDSSEHNDLGPYYILNEGGKCSITYNNHLFNPYYSKLDTSSKYDVYQQNGIIDKIYYLPEYPLHSLYQYHYSISQGKFIGFDKTCKTKYQITTELLANIDSKLTSAKYLNISSFTFTIIAMIIQCVISFELFFSYTFDGLNFKGFLCSFACFIVFIMELIAYFLPSSIKLPTECVDDISKPILELITISIHNIRIYTLIVSIFSIAYIIMFLVDIPLVLIQDIFNSEGSRKDKLISENEINNTINYQSI